MTHTLLRALNGPLLILLVAIGIGLQSSLFASWPLTYFQPDVILLAVIWCALRRGLGEGGLITLIIADIGEIHSAVPQGVFLISYMAVYLLVRASSRFFSIPTLSSFAMVTLVSSIIYKIANLFLLYLLGVSEVSQWKHTVTFLFLGAAIEAALCIWFFRWLEKFDWITFKTVRGEQLVNEELQWNSEGV